MKTIKFYSLLLGVLFTSQAWSASQRELAIELLDKIATVKLQMTQEKQNWHAEKRTLELEQSLLLDSAKRAVVSHGELEKKLAELKEQKQQVLKTLKQTKNSVSTLDATLNQSQEFILQSLDQRNPAGVSALLKGQRKDLVNAKTIDEKIAAQRNYLVALIDYQKQIHRFTESLEVNKQQIQATVIYLGTVNGYYITEDQTQAGTLQFTSGSWVASNQPELREAIGVALEQMERTGKPRLVDLPMLLQEVGQ